MELLRWCRLQWDRVLAVAAMTGGMVALVLGWAGASRTEYVAKQVPYAVSGGLGCLAFLMIGGTLWLSADFRDEWRALDRLEDQLAGHHPLLDELDRRLERLEHLELTALRPSDAPNSGPDIAPDGKPDVGPPIRRDAGPAVGCGVHPVDPDGAATARLQAAGAPAGARAEKTTSPEGAKGARL